METTIRTVGRDALNRDEARRRRRLLSDLSYQIRLNIERGDETFESDVLLRFACVDQDESTFIDLVAPHVDLIELNGKRIVPGEVYDGFRIQLDGLEARNSLRVVANCAYSHSGAGLHRFRDLADGATYLYSQFESRDAHRAFACFDQPDLKASFAISVGAPQPWTVISNTRRKQPAGSDSARWDFETTKLLSSYLIAVVAGPYHSVHDRHGAIELGAYCRESMTPYLDTDEIFEITKQGLDFFSDYFDYPYVWGKYDQLFVPEFNAGAMENAGAVTFNEAHLFRSRVTDAQREARAGTILHEMAHMWFGDLVTMEWWDDLWLNESFATYMAYLSESRATRWKDAWVRFLHGAKPSAIALDQSPVTHPIVADVPDTDVALTNFDSISYAKGACVLKQLVASIGEESFVNGLRHYFRRNEFGNADLSRFLAALEEASGRDLSAWGKEWLETAGVNLFRPVATFDGPRYMSFSLLQSPAMPAQPTLRLHRIALGLYDLENDQLRLRRRLEIDAKGHSTPLFDLQGEPEPDLLLINDGDLSYCKIRLDPRSIRTATHHLSKLGDPIARGLCWTASVDQLRDAELPARTFVELVLNNIHAEHEPAILERLLDEVSEAIDIYGAPANREHLLLRLATRALAEVRAADPGNDLQLVWMRALISAARVAEHVSLLGNLLNEENAFPGLSVDTDIRWLVIKSLAALGRIGDEVIEAELERDRTHAGQQEAASARALVPSQGAKEIAWRAILDDSISLRLKAARYVGFQRPEQADLIAPYAERYFEALDQVWASKTSEVARSFCANMYPSVLMNVELIDMTDRYLANHEAAPPAIRRYLVQNRDLVSRALRARALDQA